MILTDLRQYLSDHKRARIDDLCIRFDSQPDAMRAMLSHWMHKGRVRRIGETASCRTASSCCGCAKAEAEIYEWVEKV